jgi:hypothetical protein
MRAKSTPLPAPQDRATPQLVAALESAVGGMQERLANFAADGQDAKWSVADGDAKASLATGAKLLQLHDQLQEEQPRMITVRWVDDEPEPDTW